jgi:BirA family biotin operon repressor/biotin-[acetyl-CoA-carboxylase] ligase
VTKEYEHDWHALSLPDYFADHYHFESTDSTNDQAKKIVNVPENRMVLITASTQTSGRGQHGNSFFSGKPGNIYASIICPIDDIGNHFHYNRSLSLAILNELEHIHQEAPLSIKWPNDIYWNDKKVCGMLLESTPQSSRHIILGVGINVNIHFNEFPEDLKTSATSGFIETGTLTNCPELLKNICIAFHNHLSISPVILHSRYCTRLYRKGSPVRINNTTGIFSTVLEDGRFGLQTKTEMIYFSAGSPEFRY